MRNQKLKDYLLLMAVFLVATMTSLWCWNTLSELFGLPHAQYKHVIAASLLLMFLKWGLLSHHLGDHHSITHKV